MLKYSPDQWKDFLVPPANLEPTAAIFPAVPQGQNAGRVANVKGSEMPFDVENSVRYDSHYLAGFTSERRDSNLDQLSPIAHTQAEDVARHRAHGLLKFYDRGVRSTQEDFDVRGNAGYRPILRFGSPAINNENRVAKPS